MRFHTQLITFLILGCPLALGASLHQEEDSNSPQILNLGSQLELFVDEYLIDTMDGVELELQHPRHAEKVFTFDKPWEGNTPFHVAVFKDGNLFRMYYRGSAAVDYFVQGELERGEKYVADHKKTTCYAESRDGIHWTRPSLGQVEFNGSSKNNILEIRGAAKFNPFKDQNPAAPASSRYKGIAFVKFEDKRGLIPLASSDAIHWRWMSEDPVIVDGAFDSHNVAFWDEKRGLYVALYRDFRHGVRTLKHATSRDFIQWSDGQWVDYGRAPSEQLYTSAAIPYFRAPQIYLAFPKRFVTWRLPQHLNGNVAKQLGGLSDCVFMSSRDGVHWYRFIEAFIRPGRNKRNWIHRNGFMARGLIATAPDEISQYMLQHYTYPTAHLQRVVSRTDGFTSLSAGYPGGEIITKPLQFSGENLFLNYATSAAGTIQVEIQDQNGQPVPGFSLTESVPIWGDEIEGKASWHQKGQNSELKNRRQDKPLKKISGKTVRLRFVITDADLYSIQFR